MNFKKKLIPIIAVLSIAIGTTYGFSSTFSYAFSPNELSEKQTPAPKNILQDKDTVPRYPINNNSTETYQDLEKKYPVDLKNPENIQTVVTYDVNTGNYILHTMVGDTEVGTPYTMTPDEYKKYSQMQEENNYWRALNDTVKTDNEKKFSVTDMKFSLGAADKLFGPGGVQLKTSGQAELSFGIKSNFINNPAITQSARKSIIPDFDEKFQLNVTGKVGDKVNFGMNYNTEASFDFDQKVIKLNYKGKEDDIIQGIEAGNVSMPLNSSLITGSSALFGIKTDLQFGKLKISAIASQQESETQNVNSSGGSQYTTYEVDCDTYDENRHYFLAQYFRDNYEASMKKLPLITSGITINKIEVWVTNTRGDYDNARNIVSFMDLGETDKIDKTNVWSQTSTEPFPDNNSNNLYANLKTQPGIRSINEVNSFMTTTYPQLTGGEDYDKIESARLLSSSEYSLNGTLGYISLTSTLKSDQVLAVAYQYTYNGKTYQVGEFATDKESPNSLILKSLKSTSEAPGMRSWDLMMKNIYSIGASSMQSDGFVLNIMYENDSVGTDMQYIQAGNIMNKLLLRVMNLDRLNSTKSAVPDGKFDYVEGYTALSSSGRIIFPVLEPFGSHLRKAIGNDAIADKYVYQELYDSTLVVAQEYSSKNKFKLIGKFKGSSNSSTISLNTMNVSRGSVVVTAGGVTLTEGTDYTVDYTMGTVTIINQSIIDAGTDVNVKLENQSLFNMQRKTLVGTHLEYNFSKDFSFGGTIMHLSEMPLTTKVNTGSEPISNTIWGLNTSWKTESQWLTNALDKLPFVEATQPSNIALNAEFAQLIPGHSSVISSAGLAYLDDFESTQTDIDIHYPYNWHLASTPGMFSESNLSNNTEYGKNRALFAWYTVDPILNSNKQSTPSNLRGNTESQSNNLTRSVRETEVFPNKEVSVTTTSLLSVLNLSYYPSERGPYNLDVNGLNNDGTLSNPSKRWGGMMRKLETTDFETANIEYIKFWIMDPFNVDNTDDVGGDLYFNLGDISEDILKDGKKFFENGMPVGDDKTAGVEETIWGKVPTTQSTVTAFDNTPANRKYQDVGLDGLTNDEEYTFLTYANYLEQFKTKVTDGAALSKMQNDQFSPLNDPAGDKYHYYRGTDFDNEKASILERYKHYNGTEGNAPATEDSKETYSTAATSVPDVEDVNADNTLSEYERYYEYKVSIRPNDMVLGTNYITDEIESTVTLKNGTTQKVKWYQFKIPIRNYNDKVGTISNFKSIRFIRMFVTNFQNETHLRFGTLDLVRGDWKGYTKALYPTSTPPATNATFDVSAVSIEENANKSPVNYVLPPGVTRETDPSQSQLIQQNEQSMVLKVKDLSPKDARAVYKTTSYDMRQYKRIQMFVHAEALTDAASQAQNLKDDELACFIRIGSDMTNNYYEYEIPLKLTPEGQYSYSSTSDREKVWIPANMFNFPFTVLTNAKLKRNQERTGDASYSIPYETYDSDQPTNKITIVGNPSISDVENIMIGVRNLGSNAKSGEVWVDELRMSQFNEKGGWAATSNLNIGLSDLGSLTLSGQVQTAGYGSLESTITQRSMDNHYQYNITTALDLGRFLPSQAKLQIPTYYSYGNEITSPDYNPYDEDILLAEALDNLKTDEARDSLKNITQNVRTVESFSVANAKINIKSKKPQFYDPANITVSYSSNVTKEHTPEITQDLTKTQQLGLNYSYSFNNPSWEPFKKSKMSNALALIKDFNLNYLPNSISYNTNMNRTFNKTLLRDLTMSSAPIEGLDTVGLTFGKNFTWTRQFNIQWNLTKGLNFGLTTAMNANIEETYYTPEIGEEYYTTWKNKVWQSIKNMGTPYTYQQVFNASYQIPIDKLPLMDWATANATYNSTYSWNRSATLEDVTENYGNVASSVSNWSFNGSLNFETLYNKIPYLKDVNNRARSKGMARNKFTARKFTKTISFEKGDTIKLSHSLNSSKLIVTAKDVDGNMVKVPYKIKDDNSVEVIPAYSKKSVTVNITTKDPNDRTPAQQFADFTTRFLMGIRNVSITYQGTSSLVVPGFLNEPGLLGQSKVNGLFSPGLPFVFGIHNDNTLTDFLAKDWVYTGKEVISPANEATTSNLDVRASIEPIPGLKIELNAQRQTADNKIIQYMYEGMPSTYTGNFNITQIAIATMFKASGNANNNFYSATFNHFLDNRQIILARLQNSLAGSRYGTTGIFADGETAHSYSGTAYSETAGKFNENSPEVLIPAFLAAYTGADVTKVTTNPFLSLLEILPNWSLNYNGLSNLEFFRDKFKSVSLTHAYSNKYTIGNYTSNSSWVPINDDISSSMGFVKDVETGNPIPSMVYNISTVSMSEAFSPLIGVNLVLKNSITTKVEYRKQRDLSLNLTSTQLIEGTSDEYVIGVGYIIPDFNLFKRNDNSSRKKSSSRKSSSNQKNNLKLTADLSYKDMKTLLRKVSEDVTQASSGNKLFSLKCIADYMYNSKVNLQLYFDRSSTVPLISTTYPVSSTEFGVTFKFMLTR